MSENQTTSQVYYNQYYSATTPVITYPNINTPLDTPLIPPNTYLPLELPSLGGRKDDANKSRFDLIPPEALFALSEILTFGAIKYSDRNWEKGMSWGRVFGAGMRHLWAWWGGGSPTSKSFLFGDLDEETKRSHLWHALCCVVFLVVYEERGIGEDSRYRKSENV